MAKKKSAANKKGNTTQTSKEVLENLSTPELSSIIKTVVIIIIKIIKIISFI